MSEHIDPTIKDTHSLSGIKVVDEVCGVVSIALLIPGSKVRKKHKSLADTWSGCYKLHIKESASPTARMFYWLILIFFKCMAVLNHQGYIMTNVLFFEYFVCIVTK